MPGFTSTRRTVPRWLPGLALAYGVACSGADLTGYWMFDAQRSEPWPANVQLTAAAADRREHFDPATQDPTRVCMPFGMPRVMTALAAYPMEIVQRDEQITLLFDGHDEIRRLLKAIPAYQRYPGRLEPSTLRAILLALYGAGLRRGEALGLSVADVDLANSLLTVRDTKFFKSRLVPIGPDLTKVLSDYARWRSDNYPSVNARSSFFIGRQGRKIHRWTLQDAFEQLREYAGVRRADGGRYQPRLHDLRHTFAVHRLTAWYRQGADVQRLIYHLSIYLGHARLSHTQVYLTMTPELLQRAGTLFEQYARREGRHA